MKTFGLLVLASSVSAATIIETAQSVDALSKLVEVLTNEDYSDILALLQTDGPFTVFAPTNDAFVATPLTEDVELNKEILKFHVLGSSIFSANLTEGSNFPQTLMTNSKYVLLDGDGQFLDVEKSTEGAVTISPGDVTVTSPDVACSNGVVHIVDKVITPFPGLTSATATGVSTLSTLVESLVSSELVATVDTTASVTIFAPDNDAFAATASLNLTAAQLKEVLKAHVVIGAVAHSTDLTDGQMVETAQGESIEVSLAADGGVTLKLGSSEAKVTKANVAVKNGVVHFIDTVLVPAALSPSTPTPAPTGSVSALVPGLTSLLFIGSILLAQQ